LPPATLLSHTNADRPVFCVMASSDAEDLSEEASLATVDIGGDQDELDSFYDPASPKSSSVEAGGAKDGDGGGAKGGAPPSTDASKKQQGKLALRLAQAREAARQLLRALMEVSRKNRVPQKLQEFCEKAVRFVRVRGTLVLVLNAESQAGLL
jgi:hypothetical protein